MSLQHLQRVDVVGPERGYPPRECLPGIQKLPCEKPAISFQLQLQGCPKGHQLVLALRSRTIAPIRCFIAHPVLPADLKPFRQIQHLGKPPVFI